MIPNSNEQRDGLVVNLRNNFEINARNGEQKNIILGVKVIQRNSGNVVFQKQVDNFGSIRVKN
jgi:preprotein translocase subunit SecB